MRCKARKANGQEASCKESPGASRGFPLTKVRACKDIRAKDHCAVAALAQSCATCKAADAAIREPRLEPDDPRATAWEPRSDQKVPDTADNESCTNQKDPRSAPADPAAAEIVSRVALYISRSTRAYPNARLQELHRPGKKARGRSKKRRAWALSPDRKSPILA